MDLLLSWHLILVSVRKSKAMVGSGCPVPLKLERCFYMNLQPIFPMLCASSDDQETCNQKTFQTFFSSIKQVCRLRKGLASKYLEDWLLLFHQNLLRAKGWSAFVILPPSHGISISPLKYEWVLSLEPVTLDRKGHQPVMLSIIVYIREFQYIYIYI